MYGSQKFLSAVPFQPCHLSGMLSIVSSLTAFQLYYRERSPEMVWRDLGVTLGFLFDSLERSKKENMDGFKFEKSRELLVLLKYFLVLNLVG